MRLGGLRATHSQLIEAEPQNDDNRQRQEKWPAGSSITLHENLPVLFGLCPNWIRFSSFQRMQNDGCAD